jgi:pectin methylesterase-like acyl-CoA thioesterase
VDPKDPTAFKSIQEAIDAAWDFDTIVVHPGVYGEHIDYHGSMLTVRGTDCNDPTVIESTILWMEARPAAL